MQDATRCVCVENSRITQYGGGLGTRGSRLTRALSAKSIGETAPASKISIRILLCHILAKYTLKMITPTCKVVSQLEITTRYSMDFENISPLVVAWCIIRFWSPNNILVRIFALMWSKQNRKSELQKSSAWKKSAILNYSKVYIYNVPHNRKNFFRKLKFLGNFIFQCNFFCILLSCQ